MYRVYEVAQHYGVSEKTVRRWITRGELVALRKGKLLWVSRSAIEEFEAQHFTVAHPAAPDARKSAVISSGWAETGKTS